MNSRRIALVEALGDHTLKLNWQDGGQAVVDMTGIVHKNAYFASLQVAAEFARVEVVAHGTGIEWANGIDYSADSLEVLAREQATMAPDDLRHWKQEMRLSSNEMAHIFGVSVSTIKAYLGGSSTIPVAFQIACEAMRRDPAILYARFRPRVAGRPRKAMTAA